MLLVVNITKQRNTAIALLIALVVMALGVLFLWIGSHGTYWYHYVASQLGSALLVAAGLGLLWDWWGRRLLADEIYEKLKVGNAVIRWGIKDLSLTWNEQPWKELFAKGPNVDVMLGYGQTWRGVTQSGLEEFLAGGRNTLRVCLPDPELDWLMLAMSKRYSTTPTALRAKVVEAAKYFAGLSTAGNAKVQIFFRAGEPLYGLYRFESVALVTLYPHLKAKSTKVPALTMERGEMVEWLKQDFEDAIDGAREVQDEELRGYDSEIDADAAPR